MNKYINHKKKKKNQNHRLPESISKVYYRGAKWITKEKETKKSPTTPQIHPTPTSPHIIIIILNFLSLSLLVLVLFIINITNIPLLLLSLLV